MSPKISVITPVKARNAQEASWLSYAIQSVLDQTFTDWEMVIVNDASPVPIEVPDDPRIHLHPGGNGCAASRNLAASLARGQFLLPLDADDKLAKNAMKLFLQGWEDGGKEHGFVYSDVMIFGDDFSRLIAAPYYDFDHLLRSTFISVGALHLRTAWDLIGGWSEKMEGGLEDWDYWITAGKLGICGWRVEQPLYWYRRHPDSRLSTLRATEGAWGKAYAVLRDKHRDVYRGRKPMGCCGGRRQAVATGTLQPQIKGKTVLMEYTGKREGAFWVKGLVSGIRYRIGGTGSRFRIDARDIDRIEAMPSIRRASEQVEAMTKRAEPPAEDGIRADKEAFDPTKMEEGVARPAVPDPGEMSVSALRSADFDVTPQVAARMLELEMAGKKRRTAIRALKRKL